MPFIDYSTRRPRLHWFAQPTLLSAAPLAHFLFSASTWLQWFAGILGNPDIRDEFLPSLRASASAFIICGLSAASLVLALRGHRLARRAALVVLLAATATFLTDVHYGRWQIHTFVATQEYWEAGGRRHDYFTWWWYNDRWFESRPR